jgi:hypothetical protein
MMYSKKMLAMAAIALVSMSLFTSCKDDDDDDSATPAATGRLMAIHASPDAPGVDLLLDNAKINTDPVEFLDNTNYLTVNAGTRNVKINAAGTTTTVLNADITVASGKSYSLFAVDSLSNLGAVLIEDNLATPASGKAHVRFIHLSPNAPAVDVAVDGGAVVFGDYTFKEASAFTPLDAGTYDLEVRVAGTTTVALDLDPITLTAGKIYTVYAKGFLGGTAPQDLGAAIIVNN